MDILTDNKIKQYRVKAVLYTALPQYRTEFDDPLYWDDGLGKQVDPHALEKSLKMNGENVARHVKGKIPECVLYGVAREIGGSVDEISNSFEPEEILELGIGKSYFTDLAISYINEAMKKNKRDIHGCMPCRAIDSYALQLAESSIKRSLTTMGMKVTRSRKSPLIWMVDVPNKIKVEKARPRGSVKPRYATNIIKVGLGTNGRMSSVTEDFASNVIPTVKRNLIKYRDSLYDDYRSSMQDITHSAEVLGVEI